MLPSHGPWPDLQYQASVSSCGVGLKSKQKFISLSRSLYAALHSWEYLGRPVISEASRVHRCKTLDGVSPPAACIAPSLDVKVSWKETSR